MSAVEKSNERKLNQFEERHRVVNVCRSASDVLIDVLIVLRTHAHRCTSGGRITLSFQRNPPVVDCGMYLRNRGSGVRIPPAARFHNSGSFDKALSNAALPKRSSSQSFFHASHSSCDAPAHQAGLAGGLLQAAGDAEKVVLAPLWLTESCHTMGPLGGTPCPGQGGTL
jgi:hypothetical protein